MACAHRLDLGYTLVRTGYDRRCPRRLVHVPERDDRIEVGKGRAVALVVERVLVRVQFLHVQPTVRMVGRRQPALNTFILRRRR